MDKAHKLIFVYDGWNGYQRSQVSAVEGLIGEQLEFRGSPEMRSVKELVWHIAAGRVDWFHRMGASGAAELAAEIAAHPAPPTDAVTLVDWLQRTWNIVQAVLEQWTIEDLAVTYEHEYWGKVYAISRQWTIWRILTHDVHHGGQLSELLAMQGVFPSELTALGGHLTEPPIVRAVGERSE